MEIRLPSITSQIPWWLACRAAAACLAWFLAPFWLFFIFANYLYWFPLFGARAFLAPFILALLLGAFSSGAWWGAVVIGAVFFLMLGAKEMAFVHRARIYELLAVALLFWGSLEMSIATRGMNQVFLPAAYALFGIAFAVLRESAARYLRAHGTPAESVSVAPALSEARRQLLMSVLGGLLVWEFGSALAKLPLEAIGASAALFAGAAGLFMFMAAGTEWNVAARARRYGWVFLAVIAAVITAASWTL